MARPSYNIPLDNSIPSYESGRDNRGYKWPQVSSAHPFSVPAADPSVSPNHLLYNHHLQRSSAPLAPNYWIPAVPSDLDLYLSSQDVIHHSLLEDIGTARPFPMEGVSPGPVTTTGSASPSSDCSIQEIPQPKVNGHRGAKAGMSFQRRGARKQNPGDIHGTFRCNWKDCPYPGMFSRKRVLMRHIETQHVTPHSFGCPECGRLFSRNDNMTEHLGRVHLKRT